ncbi:MAG: hypothetical protein WDW38_010131 [Sanguina aurantia]
MRLTHPLCAAAAAAAVTLPTDFLAVSPGGILVLDDVILLLPACAPTAYTLDPVNTPARATAVVPGVDSAIYNQTQTQSAWTAATAPPDTCFVDATGARACYAATIHTENLYYTTPVGLVRGGGYSVLITNTSVSCAATIPPECVKDGKLQDCYTALAFPVIAPPPMDQTSP